MGSGEARPGQSVQDGAATRCEELRQRFVQQGRGRGGAATRCEVAAKGDTATTWRGAMSPAPGERLRCLEARFEREIHKNIPSHPKSYVFERRRRRLLARNEREIHIIFLIIPNLMYLKEGGAAC